jgi:hypothetical protein
MQQEEAKQCSRYLQVSYVSPYLSDSWSAHNYTFIFFSLQYNFLPHIFISFLQT